MNIKKLFSILLVMIALCGLFGCGSDEVKEIWEAYENAVNSKNIEGVAKTFYVTDSNEYKTFIEENINYFDEISDIKTNSIETTVDCDFSSNISIQRYYKALVKANVKGVDREIELYISHGDNGLLFTSPIKVTDGKMGNQASDVWNNTIYYSNDDYSYAIRENGESEDVVILRNISNKKEATIPAEIDGKKVTTIGQYAFYQYNKILCFTTRTSKLQKLTLSEGLLNINKYAFFQCNDLESVIIPKSVEKIDEMAFTGCRSLKELTFLRETVLEGEREEIESKANGGGDKPLVIKGAYNMKLGEIINLSTVKYEGSEEIVTWKADTGNITVNSDTGEVFASAVGKAKVTVSLKNNSSVSASVEFNITAVDDFISISGDSFNRCSSLESIYIYAYNPNTIKLATGTKFNLTKEVKIVVPKGAKNMYAKADMWAPYADQIIEME